MNFIQTTIHQMIDAGGAWPVAFMVVGVVVGFAYFTKIILGR